MPITRSGTRAVICLHYVAPLRLVTVISIWADLLFALLYRDALTLPIKLFMLIHLVLAASILLECRRSESYHRIYGTSRENDRNRDKSSLVE
ncbi:MAG: hypothetical protein C4531_05865 [Desulfurivibrio sp.]|nr:MAG: hypothetical protein C4531_05865 [Desulfurivibrio sp.]